MFGATRVHNKLRWRQFEWQGPARKSLVGGKKHPADVPLSKVVNPYRLWNVLFVAQGFSENGSDVQRPEFTCVCLSKTRAN